MRHYTYINVVMNSYKLKDVVESQISEHDSKVWLVRYKDHRLDFQWSVGRALSHKVEKLFWDQEYMLFGQNVPESTLNMIERAFEGFINEEYADKASSFNIAREWLQTDLVLHVRYS